MNTDLDTLFARVCDGRADAEELAELHRRLRADPAVLDAWLRYSALHGDLAAVSAPVGEPAVDATEAGVAEGPSPMTDAARPVPARGYGWTQLAAGLMLGLFAASIVWAYVGAPARPATTLLAEDFEGDPTPLAARTVLETGIWRGDAAEIVGAQNGVTPASGTRMMRFRRDDFDGRPKPDGGHIAVVYRLIDLRPHRAALADGAGVVEVSARFNASAFPEDEKYGVAISLYALDADTLPDRVGRLGSTLANDALAMARSSATKLDRDPATWQRLTTELRLPPGTEFLVVRLHVSQAFRSGDNAVFTGGYADDIHVSLVRRAPLP